MQKSKKIVLLGYMASGKTSLGKVLATSLDCHFIDLDDYIAKKEKLSISDLFDKKGEAFFRKKEKKYLKKIIRKDKSFVLALGGGTPEIKGVMKLLNKYCISFYLNANTQTLYNRLAPKTVERPLLTNISEGFLKEYIDMHLEKRGKHYKKANYEVSVDDLSIAEIVAKIVSELKKDKASIP